MGKSSPCNGTDWTLTGGLGGPGERQAEHEPALAAKVPTAPGMCEQNQNRWIKGSDHLPLLST